MEDYITIIGGGLAGSEAAYQIAKRGIKVKLYEMKPSQYSPAHSNSNLAEVVCSNSFKSNLHTNACGLLKEELRLLDSLLIRIADDVAVPAGQALAVDREEFADKVTKTLENMDNVEIIRQEVGKTVDYIQQSSKKLKENIKRGQMQKENESVSLRQLVSEGIVIIATGPLTSNKLSCEISELIQQEELHFYDAAAPIIEKDSINMEIAFSGNRYEQERGKDEDIDVWKNRIALQENSYINLPMNKEEYKCFWNELIHAEVVQLHEFEKRDIFEGCMPIEIMAKRGIDTLRFGPLKPVGFTDLRTGKRPYAVVQLRQDNEQGTIFNMVGFQTNLKFGEQKRVFKIIPGLQNAEFAKYGVMHRNTFINSPDLLDATYHFKNNTNIYFAGQITGVEGYVESIASGVVAGINAAKQFECAVKKDNNHCRIVFPSNTMIGALAKYISVPNERFQPMNANFGILPELLEKVRDKKLRHEKIADRALEELKRVIIENKEQFF